MLTDSGNDSSEQQFQPSDETKSLSFLLLIVLLALPTAHMIHNAFSSRLIMNPDPAGYAILGRNMINGNGFTTDVVWNFIFQYDDVSHPEDSFTTLQPLAIAGSILLFGDSIPATKLPNIIYYLALVLSVYFIAGRITGRPWYGFAGAMAVAFNPFTYNMAAYNNFNDLGFAFFVLWAFYYLWSIGESKSSPAKKDLILAGIFTGFALLQKPQGVLILMSALVWFPYKFREQRIRRSVSCFGIIFGIALLVNMPVVIRNLIAFGTVGFPSHSYQNVMHSFAWGRYNPLRWHAMLQVYYDNLPTYSDMISRHGAKHILLIAPLHRFMELSTVFIKGRIVPYPMLFFSILGLYFLKAKANKTGYGLLLLTFMTLSILFVLLNHFEDRYYFFLVPLFAPAFGIGLIRIFSSFKSVPLRILITIAIAITAGVMTRDLLFSISRMEARGKVYSGRSALYNKISELTKPGENILCFNPFSMAYHTGRKAIAPPDADVETIIKITRHYKIKYLLAVKDRGLIEILGDPDTPIKNLSVFLPMMNGDEAYGFKKVYEQDGLYYFYRLPDEWISPELLEE